ncbi:hypothetical protein ABT095_09405 [Kitasatospora sp. NPDC002227]|uniref:hypothetical protein n=1 Tax=Kitasatospora sp. NPDC002227 TaxID=3154773 RepID=UPI0033313DAD
MSDQENTAPAVWDPTARGGAGGWVRRPGQQPPAPTAPIARPYIPPAQNPGPPPPSAPQYPGYGFPPAAGAPTGPGPGGPAPQAARPAANGFPPGPGQPPVQAGYGFPPAAGAPAAPGGGYGFPPADPAGDFPLAAPNSAAAPTSVLPPVPGGPQGPGQGGRPPYPGFQPPGAPAPRFGQQQFPNQPGGQFPSYAQQQPGSYGQYSQYEDLSTDPEPRGGGNRKVLLAALGAVVVLLAGAGAVWAMQGDDKNAAAAAPAHSSAPAPAPQSASSAPAGQAPADPGSGPPTAASTAPGAGPDAAAQAKALDDLLAQGENAKAPIGNAVAQVRSCTAGSAAAAVKVLDAGATQRDQLVASLAKLSVSDLPGGADLSQLLKTAWQRSAEVDRAYAAWARTVASQGCANGKAPVTADLQRTTDLNPQATQAKQAFVAKWNPLAGSLGLTPRTDDRI